MFDRYAEAYMVGEASTIAQMCELPFLAVRDGDAIHIEDAPALRAHFTALMDAYAAAGPVQAEIAALDATELGSSCALASVGRRALGEGGATLRTFSTTNHVLRDDGSWRILSYTNHD